jgi:hypothetical protein
MPWRIRVGFIEVGLEAAALEQFLKLLDREPGIAHNAAHRKGVHWVISRNREDPRSIGQDDVFALTKNVKSGLL